MKILENLPQDLYMLVLSYVSKDARTYPFLHGIKKGALYHVLTLLFGEWTGINSIDKLGSNTYSIEIKTRELRFHPRKLRERVNFETS
jgi:hypothetical protein